MICHIVQNGGYMLLILILYMIVFNSIKGELTLTVREFCVGNMMMHNIEPGEPYVLTLKSDFSSDINKLYHKHYKRKCRQEFKTTDSAGHFEVAITNMNIPSCLNSSCWCNNYFEISVFEHSKRFCGNKEDFFSSKSDKLTIDFNPGYARPFDVTLTFHVKRNFYIITGTPSGDTSVPSNMIETPYFPRPYSPNYQAEYMIHSNILDGHVMLLFLDFMIGQQAFIEVSRRNISSSRFYGNGRPPPIISNTNELSLKFDSNDQRDMPGFSAEVWFVKSIDELFIPYTECGGIQGENYGFMHINTQEIFRLYDCIWHVIPSFISTRSNLSVFVNLRDIGYKSYLEFRQDRYSKSGIIQIIDCESQNCTVHDTEIVPTSDCLYIRFRGYLEAYSVVNISYNTFHTGSCSNDEFACNDGRCLKSSFKCDNIKQCPDGIDEDNCQRNVIAEEETYHPTVYTQDMSNTTHISWILVVGIVGILTVLLAVFIFFYNRCKQATPLVQVLPQETIDDQLSGTPLVAVLPQETISDQLSGVQPILFRSNSCGCDNPPSYEDFMKSSENYPPPLYTRANSKANIKHSTQASCSQCTTSFCTGARVRHNSADSHNVRCSDSGSDIRLNIIGESSESTHPISSTRCNIEINHNITFNASNNIKRAFSVDSTLNVNKDSCNVCLSITHPVCAHMQNDCHHNQCNTLPSNLKINASKENSYSGDTFSEPVSYRSNSSMNSKERRCTWSFVHGGSEIVTTVKTRCFSDPCKGISVHCSLY